MTLPISGSKTTFKIYLLKKNKQTSKGTHKTPPVLIREEGVGLMITVLLSVAWDAFQNKKINLQMA